MIGIKKSRFYTAIKPHLRLILLIGLIAVFILSVSMLMLDYAQEAKEENTFIKLAQMMKDNASSSAPPENIREQALSESDNKGSGILAQYQALHRLNPDITGWISIDGTPINYPVMVTPDGGDFYLNHGFDKEKTRSGVPFIDERCAVNPLGINTIIYGHHMKNGTMFAGLEQYRDENFYTKHPTIRFDTLYARQEYRIIAAFESQLYQKNEKTFKFYNYANIGGTEDFNDYIENIKALSFYDTGVATSYGDSLLTLVTCAYQTENGRFVVVARKENIA